jgi:aldehyde dehydrogenase (NAD+)
MITIWKLAPCIAAGNVLIIKTAELSPLYGLKLAQLVKEAGFPPGVINILTGLGTEAGRALSSHMEISKIAFTGSGTVGRQIMIAAAKSNLKKVTLELGGKSASIIFDDADLDNAVFWSVIGITAHNGQICAAGSRVYVQAGIYDRFIAAFREKSLQAVAGDPLLAESTKGPVISRVQREKIMGHIEEGVEQGGKLLYGGKEIERKGNFVENTAFVDVGEDMSLMQEEIFGPVAVGCFSFPSCGMRALTRPVDCQVYYRKRCD